MPQISFIHVDRNFKHENQNKGWFTVSWEKWIRINDFTLHFTRNSNGGQYTVKMMNWKSNEQLNLVLYSDIVVNLNSSVSFFLYHDIWCLLLLYHDYWSFPTHIKHEAHSQALIYDFFCIKYPLSEIYVCGVYRSFLWFMPLLVVADFLGCYQGLLLPRTDMSWKEAVVIHEMHSIMPYALCL